MTWRNWSGSVSCDATVVAPESVDDVVEAVEDADELRVAGSGHSFSPLVATYDTLLLPDGMKQVEVDVDRGVAEAEFGVTLRELASASAEHGLAPENLGDVDRQTVAGATATGTHGTGEFPVISNQISAVELVTADGDRRRLEEGDVGFDFARLSLGSLGVVTKLEWSLVDGYGLRMERGRRPLDEVLAGFRENVDRYRNYEFFWFPYTDTAITKTSTVTDAEGGSRASGRLENLAWGAICKLSKHLESKPLARLTSKTMRPTVKEGAARFIYPEPREVRFHETEYGVPVEELADCFHEIREVVERHDTVFPVEVRFVEADDLPLSPAYGRDTAFVAVHRYHEKSYEEVFQECMEVFERYDGRPHWGKMHSTSPDRLHQIYPELESFLDHRKEMDPDGVFLNDYLRRLFGVRR